MGVLDSFQSNNPFRHHGASPPSNVDDVAPPPGPPPARRPGAGPPLSSSEPEEYAAPPEGPPPPSYYNNNNDNNNPHNWQEAVPDTSLLPPPPDLFAGWDKSPVDNATGEQAEAGEAWCSQYPLVPPMSLDAEPALRRGAYVMPRLVAPPGAFTGTLAQAKSSGTWTVKTDKRAGDSCIIGYPPAYVVQRDSPLATGGRPKTVYFEVHVGHECAREVGLAIGFTALPYPAFRMPGWHRGSLAVHGDDGHKYVNDRWGGKTFTSPFRRGEVVGIGMVFTTAGAGAGAGAGGSSHHHEGKGRKGSGGSIEVEVFFTRQGREVGRWSVHEALDAERDLPVTGLEGHHDLSVAVGTFGKVGAEVVLDPARWTCQEMRG